MATPTPVAAARVRGDEGKIFRPEGPCALRPTSHYKRQLVPLAQGRGGAGPDIDDAPGERPGRGGPVLGKSFTPPPSLPTDEVSEGISLLEMIHTKYAVFLTKPPQKFKQKKNLE